MSPLSRGVGHGRPFRRGFTLIELVVVVSTMGLLNLVLLVAAVLKSDPERVDAAGGLDVSCIREEKALPLDLWLTIINPFDYRPVTSLEPSMAFRVSVS